MWWACTPADTSSNLNVQTTFTYQSELFHFGTLLDFIQPQTAQWAAQIVLACVWTWWHLLSGSLSSVKWSIKHLVTGVQWAPQNDNSSWLQSTAEDDECVYLTFGFTLLCNYFLHKWLFCQLTITVLVRFPSLTFAFLGVLHVRLLPLLFVILHCPSLSYHSCVSSFLS